MPVNYDFYTNPKPDKNKTANRYHARVVPKGTIDAKMLAHEIQDRCSLTAADIAGALVALADITAEKLANGYCVQLDGIGTLQLTLKCPQFRSINEIRGESVQVKSIAFRPSVRIKDKLKKTVFVRQKEKLHSQRHTDKEIDALVTAYFRKNETLTRSQFQQLCGLTCSTAVRQLRRLRKEMKIVNIASKKHPLYRKPAESQEGKE